MLVVSLNARDGTPLHLGTEVCGRVGEPG